MPLKTRQCATEAAQKWFDLSRAAQNAGRDREAIIYMENALLQAERELSATKQALDYLDVMNTYLLSRVQSDGDQT